MSDKSRMWGRLEGSSEIIFLAMACGWSPLEGYTRWIVCVVAAIMTLFSMWWPNRKKTV